MEKSVPIGKRFSHVYIDRGNPAPDGARLRQRLYELSVDLLDRDDVARALRKELGINVFGNSLREKLSAVPIVDVLDSVTVIFALCADQELPGSYRSGVKARWLAGVGRILQEENVGYRVDGKGGVHFLVDEELERVRVSTIQGFGKARYQAAREEFDKAFAALDAQPQDTKLAVRSAFESVEILFRLMVDDTKCQRLGNGEVGRFLKPLIAPFYAADEAGRLCVDLLLKSMEDWVAAAHFYRHGQAIEEPAPPPLEVCLVLLSQAAIYLRWMVELDQKMRLQT